LDFPTLYDLEERFKSIPSAVSGLVRDPGQLLRPETWQGPEAKAMDYRNMPMPSSGSTYAMDRVREDLKTGSGVGVQAGRVMRDLLGADMSDVLPGMARDQISMIRNAPRISSNLGKELAYGAMGGIGSAVESVADAEPGESALSQLAQAGHEAVQNKYRRTPEWLQEQAHPRQFPRLPGGPITQTKIPEDPYGPSYIHGAGRRATRGEEILMDTAHGIGGFSVMPATIPSGVLGSAYYDVKQAGMMGADLPATAATIAMAISKLGSAEQGKLWPMFKETMSKMPGHRTLEEFKGILAGLIPSAVDIASAGAKPERLSNESETQFQNRQEVMAHDSLAQSVANVALTGGVVGSMVRPAIGRNLAERRATGLEQRMADDISGKKPFPADQREATHERLRQELDESLYKTQKPQGKAESNEEYVARIQEAIGSRLDRAAGVPPNMPDFIRDIATLRLESKHPMTDADLLETERLAEPDVLTPSQVKGVAEREREALPVTTPSMLKGGDVIESNRKRVEVLRQKAEAAGMPVPSEGVLPTPTGTVGEVKAGSGIGGLVPRREVDEQGFFSPIIEGIKTGLAKGHPQYWMNHLAKFGGAKEEAKWAGLDDFLKTKDSFTREELDTFMLANKIEVEEKWHSNASDDNPELDALHGDVSNAEEGVVIAREGYRDEVLDRFDVDIEGFTDRDRGDLIADAEAALADARTELEDYQREQPRDTKWTQYTEQTPSSRPPDEQFELVLRLPEGVKGEPDLSGGTNHYPYKNQILHVRFNVRQRPDGKSGIFLDEAQSDQGQRGRDKGFRKIGADAGPELGKLRERLKAVEVERERLVMERDDLGDKRSERFRQLDEEIVRDLGYRSAKDLQDKHNAARAAAMRYEAGSGLPWEKLSDDKAEALRRHNKALLEDPTVVELDRRREELDSLYDEATAEAGRATKALSDFTTRPAEAPFITDTQQWTARALKRMLRYAAENGHSYIAWTNGEQQTRRWAEALRAKVDTLWWEKVEGGIALAGTKNGQDVKLPETAKIIKGADSLRESIGAAMSRQILDSPNQSGTITGKDLTIDSAGMKHYYDVVMPSVMDKIAKKWGGKVVWRDMEFGTEYSPRLLTGPELSAREIDAIRAVWPGSGGATQMLRQHEVEARRRTLDTLEVLANEVAQGKSLREALESRLTNIGPYGSPVIGRDVLGAIGWKLERPNETQRVPMIDITPQMREGAMAGFSQFSGADPKLMMRALDHGIRLLKDVPEFGAWASRMIREIGPAIGPHVRKLYEQAKGAKPITLGASMSRSERYAQDIRDGAKIGEGDHKFVDFQGIFSKGTSEEIAGKPWVQKLTGVLSDAYSEYRREAERHEPSFAEGSGGPRFAGITPAPAWKGVSFWKGDLEGTPGERGNLFSYVNPFRVVSDVAEGVAGGTIAESRSRETAADMMASVTLHEMLHHLDDAHTQVHDYAMTEYPAWIPREVRARITTSLDEVLQSEDTWRELNDYAKRATPHSYRGSGVEVGHGGAGGEPRVGEAMPALRPEHPQAGEGGRAGLGGDLRGGGVNEQGPPGAEARGNLTGQRAAGALDRNPLDLSSDPEIRRSQMREAEAAIRAWLNPPAKAGSGIGGVDFENPPLEAFLKWAKALKEEGVDTLGKLMPIAVARFGPTIAGRMPELYKRLQGVEFLRGQERPGFPGGLLFSKGGKPYGLPEGISTPAKVRGLQARLSNLAEEGLAGKDWYRRSADAIYAFVGGDLAQAKKLAGLIAIFSANRSPVGEMPSVADAWAMHESGLKLTQESVHVTGDQLAKAQRWLDNGTTWVNDERIDAGQGKKTWSFYQNFLEHLDPADPMGHRGAGKRAVTVDVWIARAIGWMGTATEIDLSAGQYRAAQALVQAVADKLGLTPSQAQAAIWAAQQVREGADLKSMAEGDFKSLMERGFAQLNVEASPGKHTGLWPEYETAPIKQKLDVHRRIQKIFEDERGNDLIAKAVDLRLPVSHDGVGVFLNVQSPGTAKQFWVMKGWLSKKKGDAGRISEEYRKKLDAYAGTYAYFSNQNAIGWTRPLESKSPKTTYMYDLDMGVTATPAQMKELGALLGSTFAPKNLYFATIFTPNGVRILNVNDVRVPEAVWGADMKTGVLDQFSHPKFGVLEYDHDGNYIEHATGAKEGQHGDNYLQAIWDAGGSELLDKVFVLFGPTSSRETEAISKEYGWTDGRKYSIGAKPPEYHIGADGKFKLGPAPTAVPEPPPEAVAGSGIGGLFRRPPPPPTAGAALTPSQMRGEVALHDLWERSKDFVAGEAPDPYKGKNPLAIARQFYRGHVAEYSPLRKAELVYYKAIHGVAPRFGVDKDFELRAGDAAKADHVLGQFASEIVQPLKNISKESLFKYMAARRIEDRVVTSSRNSAEEAERKRVAGFDEETAKGAAASVRKTDPNYILMESILAKGGPYRRIMGEMLDMMVSSGRMSPELRRNIDQSSDFYAPFRVLTAISNMEADAASGGGRPVPGIAQLTKAITGISDADFALDKDFLKESAAQIVRAHILAGKNEKMLLLDAMARRQGTDHMRLLGPEERPRQGWAVTTYLYNGVPQRMEVAPYVERALRGLNSGETQMALETLRLFQGTLRGGTTTFNAAFQISNLLASDVPRVALMSRAGLRGPIDWAHFGVDVLNALFMQSIPTNVFGKPTPLFQRMMKNGVLNASVSSWVREESGYKRKLASHEGTMRQRGYWRTLDTINSFSQAVEETGKALAWMRMERFNKKKLSQLPPDQQAKYMREMASEVRNYGGSPDFWRHGEARQMNLIFMFYNAAMQGIERDVARLSGKTGAKDAGAAWARLTPLVLASVYYAALQASPEYKKDYDALQQWERDNYFHIWRNRYFVNADGQRVRDSFRIPKKNFVKLLANVTEEGVRYAMSEDPDAAYRMLSSVMENASPINIEGDTMQERGYSVLGSMNPAIKVPAEYITGKSFFMKTDTVPPRLEGEPAEFEADAQTPQIFKTLGALPTKIGLPGMSPKKLEAAVYGLGGGAVNQLFPREAAEGREAYTEIAPMKRFVRGTGVNYDDLYAKDRPLAEVVHHMERLKKEAPEEAAAYAQEHHLEFAAHERLQDVMKLMSIHRKEVRGRRLVGGKMTAEESPQFRGLIEEALADVDQILSSESGQPSAKPAPATGGSGDPELQELLRRRALRKQGQR
jgi:hypothetical protein